MKNTKTILAAAILSMIAIAGGMAQTTTGTAFASGTNPNAGTYLDTTLSAAQRIQLADAVVTGSARTTSPYAAASYMLQTRPVIYLLNAYPAFADSVIADPTIGGVVPDPIQAGALELLAVIRKTTAIPVLNDQIAYLQPLLSSTFFSAQQALAANAYFDQLLAKKAQIQYQAGNYAGAISTGTAAIGGNPTAIVYVVLSKITLRSADVLSWARLQYTLSDFKNTQAGINAVSSALRSLDCSLVRANAFISFQQTGTGLNPLAGTALPTGITFAGNAPYNIPGMGNTIVYSPAEIALNYAMAGDNLDALKTAVGLFSTAVPGPALNQATAFVAQWLRNIDGNLVRANAFVTAQSQGQPYNIVELSGTGN